MHPGEFGVFIPMFGMLIAALAIWTSHKQKMIKLEIEQRTKGPLAASEDSRIEYLEDRVRVLERIVTDRGYDVASQIDALRDQRQVEGQLESRSL
jgi:hypothetical protein